MFAIRNFGHNGGWKARRAGRFSSLIESNPMFPERPVNMHSKQPPPETPSQKPNNSEPDVYGKDRIFGLGVAMWLSLVLRGRETKMIAIRTCCSTIFHPNP